MSGHMVSATDTSRGTRSLFMANIADREEAREAVSRKSNIADAQVLAPVADETLAQFEVPMGEVRHFYTDGSEGLVGEGR
jgi:hypothetical protein